MKEYRVYFINAFMEVDSTFSTNEAYPQLKRVGNLFETEEEARKALHRIKLALAEK